MPSTAIRRLRYDPAEKILELEFTSGAVYEYFNVPPQVYENFAAAGSRGRFFAHRFRDKFPYRKKARERLQ